MRDLRLAAVDELLDLGADFVAVQGGVVIHWPVIVRVIIMRLTRIEAFVIYYFLIGALERGACCWFEGSGFSPLFIVLMFVSCKGCDIAVYTAISLLRSMYAFRSWSQGIPLSRSIY